MLDAAKLAIAIKSTAFLSVFVFIFLYLYWHYFWNNAEARNLLKIFMPIFGIIVFAKFLIGMFYKGYIPELLFFYAIPSPKLTSLVWALITLVAFFAFLYFRKKIEAFSPHKFLASLVLIFFIFSVGVAGIREGAKSIADPFTRTFWEYSGNMSAVRTVQDFLHNYIELLPQLAKHSVTHPPGYTLVLYFAHKYLGADFFGMALWVVFLTGLILWPLYYLWRSFLEEIETKRALEIFIFVPSAVMMTATSMDGVFLFLAQFFLFLVWFFLVRADGNRKLVATRIMISLAAFLLFFLVIWYWSGYSIVENFFIARGYGQEAVGSNFESVGMYFIYVLMNIVNFLIYLGLPSLLIFFKGLPATFKESNLLFKGGVWILLFFLVIGIFQANVERLWLFILPFFVDFKNKLLKEEHQRLFNPHLALTFFQIVVTQAMFYTFF